MEKQRQVSGGSSSSSSFTTDLFGPKDYSSSSSSSSSSTGIFGSVFGPPSTGPANLSGSQYRNAKHGPPENTTERNKCQGSRVPGKDGRSIYQNETVEPCYLSSSIYYGGQEVYSAKNQTTGSQHILKKDGGQDDPYGSISNGGASRGNWWQGSLYY